MVDRLADGLPLDAVIVHRDYTPFSRRRDGELAEACARRRIHLEVAEDLLVHVAGSVLTGAGKPYQVFTPFYRKASQRPVREPRRRSGGTLADRRVDGAETEEGG